MLGKEAAQTIDQSVPENIDQINRDMAMTRLNDEESGAGRSQGTCV